MSDLAAQLARLEKLVGDLYLPTPAEGMATRQVQSDYLQGQERFCAPWYDANAANEIRGREVWHSDPLLTKGYTQVEALCGLIIQADNVPANLGDRQLFEVVLEGTCGSAWAELATAVITSDGRTQRFPVPSLSAVTLSNAVRVVLYAADNAQYEQGPPAVRQLIMDFDVILIAGVTF